VEGGEGERREYILRRIIINIITLGMKLVNSLDHSADGGKVCASFSPPSKLALSFSLSLSDLGSKAP